MDVGGIVGGSSVMSSPIFVTKFIVVVPIVFERDCLCVLEVQTSDIYGLFRSWSTYLVVEAYQEEVPPPTTSSSNPVYLSCCSHRASPVQPELSRYSLMDVPMVLVVVVEEEVEAVLRQFSVF